MRDRVPGFAAFKNEFIKQHTSATSGVCELTFKNHLFSRNASLGRIGTMPPRGRKGGTLISTRITLRCAGAAFIALVTLPLITQAEKGDDNPTGVAGIFNGNITTGCPYDAYTGNGHREVDDIVVPGSVGSYPLKWTRYWNSHVTADINYRSVMAICVYRLECRFPCNNARRPPH